MLWLMVFACSEPAPVGSGTPPVGDPTPATTPTIDPAPADPTTPDDPSPDDTGDDDAMKQLPVLFVHGITGEAANFDVTLQHLVDQGWDASLLYAETFEDPAWGCNVDNAATLRLWIDAILADTGADEVQLVAHSMGTLSTRYLMKHLGGGDDVHNYVTLGGMHHGLQSSCSPDFPFKPCVWDEICTSGDFVTELNTAPVMPGDSHWISIYGTADETVPTWSSQLDGAVNIELDGLEHFGPNGVLEHIDALDELTRALLWE